MAGKVEMTRYRSRWMEHAGLVVVERGHEHLVMGFWPVYQWEAVASFQSGKEATEWIVNRSARAVLSQQTGSGETGE